MDESEKRKERLKAMRMEAEVSGDVDTSAAMSGYLSNPLTETSSSSTTQDGFGTAPRFDYYTDPMAAYSGNKNRCDNHSQNPRISFASPTIRGGPMPRPAPSCPGAGPRNFYRDMPVRSMPTQFSPDQGVYGHGPYDPRMRSPTPPLMHQCQSNTWNGSQSTDHYNFVRDGSPRGMFGNPPMHPETSHRAWNPSNTSGYSNFPRPGFSPADSSSFNYGTASPQMYGNRPILDQGPEVSPYFSPGRGRGRGYSGNSGPGFGRGAGRGQGFHGRGSAPNMALGPERYFDVSMLEDPWQHLKPVPLRRRETEMDSSSTHGSSNSWLRKSIGIKKAKVSEASSNKFNPQQSLAEYLASSFNKAVEDTQNQ